jgi:FdhD protein
MRTPGDDIDLAAGFLLAKGIVAAPEDIAAIRICSGEQCGHGEHERMGNIADITLRAVRNGRSPGRNQERSG